MLGVNVLSCAFDNGPIIPMTLINVRLLLCNLLFHTLQSNNRFLILLRISYIAFTKNSFPVKVSHGFADQNEAPRGP